MIMATKIRDDNFQITSPTSNGHKSEIILRIILIICSFICLGVFYMLYKMFQLPCCNENFNPSSTFTSGETISARSLIKKDETNTTNSTHGSITPLRKYKMYIHGNIQAKAQYIQHFNPHFIGLWIQFWESSRSLHSVRSVLIYLILFQSLLYSLVPQRLTGKGQFTKRYWQSQIRAV